MAKNELQDTAGHIIFPLTFKYISKCSWYVKYSEPLRMFTFCFETATW